MPVTLFPSAPAVFMGVDQRRVPRTALTEKDALVVIAIDFPVIVENLLKVLPNTANIAVVLGNSPNEQYWLEQLRADFKPFESRVAFTWFNELSFEEMLQRAAALPPNTAIFFPLLTVDAAGVPHEEGEAMTRLRAVTNAPIFSYSDVFLGKGIVGGPLISIASVGQQAASAAVRILNGEAPGDIKTPPIGYTTPRFDWNELQRWNINGSRLHARKRSLFPSPGRLGTISEANNGCLGRFADPGRNNFLAARRATPAAFRPSRGNQSPPRGCPLESGHDRKRTLVIHRPRTQPAPGSDSKQYRSRANAA
jgi:hypothetical protein